MVALDGSHPRPDSALEMAAIWELVLSWVLTTGLTYLILRLDEHWLAKRNREDRLERAWPPTSRDAAVIAFGPLCLLVHFVKTRGHFRSIAGVLLGIPWGFLLGVLALALVLFGGGLVLELLFDLLGFPAE